YTTRLGAGPASAGESIRPRPQTPADLQKAIELALRQMPDFQKINNNVKFSVTGEGLRIELLENEQGLFFVSGSSNPTTDGSGILQVLGAQLSRMSNELVIEGHTDARPFRGPGYSNWELSNDRSNAARLLLMSAGVRSNQVVEMRGFADQKLYNP